MAKISFGNHSSLRVPHRDQERVRRFYRDVLGCEVTRESRDVDNFRMGNSFFITFLYQEEVLAEHEWEKAIWLEIKSEDPQALKQKIMDFGVRELVSKDKEHLYFQAPGGQAFRLVGMDEDLTRFER